MTSEPSGRTTSTYTPVPENSYFTQLIERGRTVTMRDTPTGGMDLGEDVVNLWNVTAHLADRIKALEGAEEVRPHKAPAVITAPVHGTRGNIERGID